MAHDRSRTLRNGENGFFDLREREGERESDLKSNVLTFDLSGVRANGIRP